MPSYNDQYYGTFIIAIAPSFFAVFNYFLLSSWILDGGSDIHICNKIMLHRFRKTRDVPSKTMLIDEIRSGIEAIEKIEISINVFEKKIWKMLLIEICYIPNFMTNIAASRKFRAKKIYFDDQHMRLRTADDQTLNLVKHRFDHDLLKDNITVDDPEQYAVAMTIKLQKSGTIQYWHEVLAHANKKIIQHLQSAAAGVKVIDSSISMFKTYECETCALFKMHRIIFRSHDKKENFNQSFFRIIYDLIAMSKVLNGHEWISHLACSYNDFNMIYTHKIKDETQAMVRQSINTIKTRFNEKMIFFRTDDEKSLSGDFKKFIVLLRISYEPSSSDISVQNDHSEKKNHLLTMKTKALSIRVELPQYLWSWIIQSADYIMNRTPMKKHEWKISYEIILENKPHLNHMKKFGCKAYFLNKNIPKKRNYSHELI